MSYNGRKTTVPNMDMPQASDEAPYSPRRIIISAARRMLGMVGRNYSDEEIESVLNAI
ncbi:MAG: hypothetical protein AAFQ15_04945 [Pseudomonadota bacterium]